MGDTSGGYERFLRVLGPGLELGFHRDKRKRSFELSGAWEESGGWEEAGAWDESGEIGLDVE